VGDMTEYKRPIHIDPTSTFHADTVTKALTTEDEYFTSDKEEDPLVLIVDALLATLPADERAVIEMCIMSNISMHEAARMMGYINKSGKEDHKKVKRRIEWALRKLKETLESPSFANAIAGHKLPVDKAEVVVKDTLANIIKGLENKLKEI
jgi:DNA-directed RNA polymerase specialized sigma24 family protein